MNSTPCSGARTTIAALIGTAVACLLCTAPALAQDKSVDPDAAARMDPAPISYPRAAPGSLNLYHWNTYKRWDLGWGSTSLSRMERQEQLDRERDKRTAEYDRMAGSNTMYHRGAGVENGINPAPVGYPFAAPGSINLYHWRTYKKWNLDFGSATEEREMRAHRAEIIVTDRMRSDDKALGVADPWNREAFWDPAPMSYPSAAPGSLNLFHWRSYEKNTLEPGSVNLERQDRTNKRDMERKAMEKGEASP